MTMRVHMESRQMRRPLFNPFFAGVSVGLLMAAAVSLLGAHSIDPEKASVDGVFETLAGVLTLGAVFGILLSISAARSARSGESYRSTAAAEELARGRRRKYIG